MDSLPLIIFWSAALYCLISGPQAIIYLLFISMPFAAFAVVSPQLSAGMTLTPTPMTALLLVGRSLGTKSGVDFVLSLLIRPTRLTLLLLFWVVAVITTLFMPRLFARQVEVMPLGGGILTESFLEPTSQNISQMAYMTISVFTVLAFAYVLQEERVRQHSLKALCLGAIVVIITGALDYANQFVSLTWLLDPFRTATYALLTDVEVIGGKRVVGLTPEASSYGTLSLSFLSAVYFFRRALDKEAFRRGVIQSILLLLMACTWLSTSSAAYVGLLVFFVLVVMEWIWRGAMIPRSSILRDNMTVELVIGVGVIVVICVATLYDVTIWNPLFDTLNDSILNKNTTSSFEERGNWTFVSWNALLGTYGLGVGLGGTRASNVVVSMVSNVGVIGGIFYYGFVASVLLRRLPPGNEHGAAYVHASRWAFVAPFSAAVLAATTPDFGPLNAWMFGISLAGASAALWSNRWASRPTAA